MSVPIKSFRSMLHSIARRIGALPEGVLDAGMSGDLTDLANTAMRHAWMFFAWPDALDIREESVITHPTVTGARYVPRSSASRVMRQVFKVWDKDPRQSTDTAGNVAFKSFADGAYIYNAELSTVWVYYRPDPPEFTDTVWASDTTYAAGDLALASDGHVYKSLQGTNLNKDPLTQTAWWVQVPVLACLHEPVKQGVISHYKRYQSGQPVTAKSMEELMRQWLEIEIVNLREEEN